MEIREAYDKLCVHGTLKDEFKIVENKGLTYCLEFLQSSRLNGLG